MGSSLLHHYCTAFLGRRQRSATAVASAVCPCDRYFYCLVPTCSCTFQRESGSSFSSVSTFIMDRSTKEKCAWQDRKGSRSGHPRNERKRSAGFKGTNRHDIETDLTFASTSAAKILKKSPEFEVRIDQTFSYVILEFFLVFGALQELLKCKKCNSDVLKNRFADWALKFVFSVRVQIRPR